MSTQHKPVQYLQVPKTPDWERSHPYHTLLSAWFSLATSKKLKCTRTVHTVYSAHKHPTPTVFLNAAARSADVVFMMAADCLGQKSVLLMTTFDYGIPRAV